MRLCASVWLVKHSFLESIAAVLPLLLVCNTASSVCVPQAAEIAAAQRELQVWQQRCFPCLPGLPGEDDQQPSGGADQAGTGGPSSSSSIRLPEIKGARAVGGAGGGGGGGSSSSAALGAILVGAGGFAPHGARAARLSGALGASGGGSAAKRHYIGPDGKPELLGAARK